MNIGKEVIIETVRRMPESITYKDVAIEIVDISNIFEHLEELSDEERQKLIDLIIPEIKISEEGRKEIYDILEEMESGKEYRLEDVRAELTRTNK
jgi:hypothetical protein